MAEATHDNIKEKVQAVREVVPGKSNNEVVLVLQYYDYNVERAIQAYVEDGAKVALQEWNFTGSKQPNKKRKNKRKGNTDKAGSKPDSVAQSTVFPSRNSQEEAAVSGQVNLANGDIAHDNRLEVVSPVSASNTVMSSSSASVSSPVPSASVSSAAPSASVSSAAPSASVLSAAPSASSLRATPSATNAQPPRQGQAQTSGHTDFRHHHHQQPSARERTLSEVSTGSGMGDGHHKKPHQGLEKAIKDLHRQTTSLERLRLLLDHEIDRSIKSMKSVFEELRQGLNNREAQLMAEMEVLKQEASDMLEMRQAKARELKRQVDRSDRLKDTEVTELRAEIKHFVGERRHDEDLGRTTRFLYDSDHMLQELRTFGEVVHVKSVYTTRKASVSSVASAVSHDDGNHEAEDVSHWQEVGYLQEKLKSSLGLQNSYTRVNSSNREPSSTHNGPSSNDIDSSRQSGSPRSHSFSATTTNYYGHSSSSSQRPPPPKYYSASNTVSPGREGLISRGGTRARSRGSRGSATTRGYRQGGQQSGGERLLSSQGKDPLQVPLYSSDSSAVRTST